MLGGTAALYYRATALVTLRGEDRVAAARSDLVRFIEAESIDSWRLPHAYRLLGVCLVALGSMASAAGAVAAGGSTVLVAGAAVPAPVVESDESLFGSEGGSARLIPIATGEGTSAGANASHANPIDVHPDDQSIDLGSTICGDDAARGAGEVSIVGDHESLSLGDSDHLGVMDDGDEDDHIALGIMDDDTDDGVLDRSGLVNLDTSSIGASSDHAALGILDDSLSNGGGGGGGGSGRRSPIVKLDSSSIGAALSANPPQEGAFRGQTPSEASSRASSRASSAATLLMEQSGLDAATMADWGAFYFKLSVRLAATTGPLYNERTFERGGGCCVWSLRLARDGASFLSFATVPSGRL